MTCFCSRVLVGALVSCLFALTLAACTSAGAGGGAIAGERDPTTGEYIYAATPEQAELLRSQDPLRADRATLYVNGLSCPLCASNVDTQLARVPGVQSIQVDLATGQVSVDLLGKPRPSPAQLAAAVRQSGFTLVRLETR